MQVPYPFGGSGLLTAGGFSTPFALRQAQDTEFRLRRNLVEAAEVEP
jgi:hypothetical protein